MSPQEKDSLYSQQGRLTPTAFQAPQPKQRSTAAAGNVRPHDANRTASKADEISDGSFLPTRFQATNSGSVVKRLETTDVTPNHCML
jgi:hypothetical protein